MSEHVEPVTGLVLTGGGARAAYQVGVLSALRQLRARHAPGGRHPFPVIAGTSAGAINAAVLASGADDFDATVGQMLDVWSHFHAGQVYRADALGVIRSGAGWLKMVSIGWMLARWRRQKPRSLLNNAPLAELLSRLARLDRVPRMIQEGHLQALAVSASSYSSGLHVTFYEAAQEAVPWVRSQRLAVRQRLSVEHLLASSAIPFVFQIGRAHV